MFVFVNIFSVRMNVLVDGPNDFLQEFLEKYEKHENLRNSMIDVSIQIFDLILTDDEALQFATRDVTTYIKNKIQNVIIPIFERYGNHKGLWILTLYDGKVKSSFSQIYTPVQKIELLFLFGIGQVLMKLKTSMNLPSIVYHWFVLKLQAQMNDHTLTEIDIIQSYFAKKNGHFADFQYLLNLLRVPDGIEFSPIVLGIIWVTIIRYV